MLCANLGNIFFFLAKNYDDILYVDKYILEIAYKLCVYFQNDVTQFDKFETARCKIILYLL